MSVRLYDKLREGGILRACLYETPEVKSNRFDISLPGKIPLKTVLISKLITALKNGNLNQVKQLVGGSSRLLEQSYDDSVMFKLIQTAMDARNLPSLKLLLSRQPDLASAVYNNDSALMYSMKPKFKDLKIFQEILKYADVNERVGSLRSTALHNAIRRKLFGAFAALLNHPKIDLNVKNKDGMTPLHLASFHNLKDFVHALACSATLAGKNVDFSYKDKNGYLVHEYSNEASRHLKCIIKFKRDEKKLKELDLEFRKSNNKEFLGISMLNQTFENNQNVNVINHNLVVVNGYETSDINLSNQYIQSNDINVPTLSTSTRSQLTPQSKQLIEDQYRHNQFQTQNITNISMGQMALGESEIFITDRNINEHYKCAYASPASSNNPRIPKETADESTFNNVIPQVQVPKKGNYSLINKDSNNSSPNLENVNQPPVTELNTTSKKNDTGMKNDKYCKEICDTWDFSNKKTAPNRKYRSTENLKHTELITGSENNAAELMYSFKDMFFS